MADFNAIGTWINKDFEGGKPMAVKRWVVWIGVWLMLAGAQGYAASAHNAIKPKAAVRPAGVVKQRALARTGSVKATALRKPSYRMRPARLLKQNAPVKLPHALHLQNKRRQLLRRGMFQVQPPHPVQRRLYQAERPKATGRHEPFVYASSVLVVDQQSGQPIYAKNPDHLTPIASITKLMTALVTLEANLPLDEYITITSEDVDRIKHTSSRLPIGTQLTRRELLHLALIASENRAAAALSRAYPGGRQAFVAAMNRKARELGMNSTYFVDGTGLSSHNRSTAKDLVKLVQAAYRHPLIRAITTTASYEVEEQGLAFFNTNRLVHRNDWRIGVSKTGFINEAGYCLVMQTDIAGRPVIMVLLHSRDKWSRIADAERIRRWLEGGAIQRYVQHNRDLAA
jgi:D-alanyl-D-alanine endopeptidase (penicillin-binding protein 7)